MKALIQINDVMSFMDSVKKFSVDLYGGQYIVYRSGGQWASFETESHAWEYIFNMAGK